MGLGRRLAHEANAPDLAQQRTESAADFNAVVRQQLCTDIRFRNVRRDRHAIQHRQPTAGRRKRIQTQRTQAGKERVAVGLMPLKSSRQAFFFNEAQGLAQRIEHGNRRRVVIRPRAFSPIAGSQPHIQVPTLARRPALLHNRQCALAHCERRQSGWAA